MKIKIILVLLFVSLLSSFAFACNCGGEEVVHDIELDYYVHEIDILDEFTLTPKTTGDVNTIEWSSSNETVATVSGGKVTPVSAGETVITAKLGEKQAVCYLTVVNNGFVPNLHVSKDSLTLISGDTYPVNVGLTYKNQPCSDVTYTFTSLDENIATVNNEGLITAVSKGATRIKVVGQWRNVDSDIITEYIDVNVVRDIALKFNVKKCELFAVDNFEGVPYKNTQEITCTPYEQGVELSVPVSYTLENQDICSYEQGILTANKAGSTKLTATIEYDGETYSDAINIAVECVMAQSNKELFVSKLDPDISHAFDTTAEISKVVAHVNGEEKVLTVTDNKIQGVADLALGKIKIDVYSDKVAYSFANAEVVDLCITKPAHVEIMRSQTSGYFVLGNDVDMQNATYAANTGTFSGTFDGRGFALKNMTFTTNNVCLFYRFAGTIKNVALTNVRLGGVQGGAIGVYTKAGTVDGVYVSMSLGTSNHSGGLFKHVEAGLTKITNSIVYVTSNMTTNSGLLFSFGYSTGSVDLSGTKIIKTQAKATLVGARSGSSYDTFREATNALDTAQSPISYILNDFKTAVSNQTILLTNYNAVIRNNINDVID